MKKLQLIITALFLGIITLSFGQTTETKTSTEPEQYIITKNDGKTYQGIILSQDIREVVIRTKNIGDVAIPKHEIQSITKVESMEFRNGKYIGKDIFAHRHILTTNALPMEKGKAYALLSPLGSSEIHYGVSDNVSIGVVSSWLATPLLGSVKAGFKVGNDVYVGVGTLAGWGGPLAGLQDAFIAMPYGAVTFGNESANFTFSGGYFGVRNERTIYDALGNRNGRGQTWEGGAVYSFAGSIKVSERTSLLFDSFIFHDDDQEDSMQFFIPGVRVQSKKYGNHRAVQVGLGIIRTAYGELAPIPNISWMIRL